MKKQLLFLIIVMIVLLGAVLVIGGGYTDANGKVWTETGDGTWIDASGVTISYHPSEIFEDTESKPATTPAPESPPPGITKPINAAKPAAEPGATAPVAEGAPAQPKTSGQEAAGTQGQPPPAKTKPQDAGSPEKALEDYKKDTKNYNVKWDDKEKVWIVTDKKGKPIAEFNGDGTEKAKKKGKPSAEKPEPEQWYNFIEPSDTFRDRDGNEWTYDPQSQMFRKWGKGGQYVVKNPPASVLAAFKKAAAINEIDNIVNSRMEKSRHFASVLNPSMGALQVGKLIEQGIFHKDISLFDLFSDSSFKNTLIDIFGYFESGFETAFCKEKMSSFFTQDLPGHYVGAGEYPSLNSITIYSLGKRTEYVAEAGIDWNTNYLVGGKQPQWFPQIISAVPTTTTKATTTTATTKARTTTTTLIYSRSNPGLAAQGYLYKLQWHLKHPQTKEDVAAMSLNQKSAEGFDADGNITFTIHIKETGAPCMYKNCEQVSPKIFLEPGGVIPQTKVQYKLAYLTEVCIKFDSYKWDRYHTEYPVDCKPLKDSPIGLIAKQEAEAPVSANNLAAPASSSGGGGSDWDW